LARKLEIRKTGKGGKRHVKRGKDWGGIIGVEEVGFIAMVLLLQHHHHHHEDVGN
jgi:hypothetical protein